MRIKPVRAFIPQQAARGFTLIELLVVIAIIGILSSIVLGSLNYARGKAQDAAAISDIESLVEQAAVYFDGNGTYGTSANDCTVGLYSDQTVQNALAGVSNLNGGAAASCYANDQSYAVAVTRPTGLTYRPPTTYWCADSTGKKCGINDVSPLSSSGQCGCP